MCHMDFRKPSFLCESRSDSEESASVAEVLSDGELVGCDLGGTEEVSTPGGKRFLTPKRPERISSKSVIELTATRG